MKSAVQVSATFYLGLERPSGVAGLKPAHGPQVFRRATAWRLSFIQDTSRIHRCDHDWRDANTALALALGFLLPNGCLQQIAANRFSTPQDVIAILLQGFVYARHGRDSMGCKSPVRDWEPEGDQEAK
jgi:hypothetical protein